MSDGAPHPRPRATVIVPTYGHAPFVRCAIASAQAQTVRELEICVILDGSPPGIARLVGDLASRDPRIIVREFPKAPRTAEIHRARVLAETCGRIVCYLSHDDLWFPRHVEVMEGLLAHADFGHSLHVDAGLGAESGRVLLALLADIAHDECRRRMLDREAPCNFFGLTNAAHTRAAYERLPEGWAATPEDVWTDLHLWRKFLSAPGMRPASHLGITALHFPARLWKALFSPEEMEEELDRHLARLSDPAFHEGLLSQVLRQALDGVLDQRAAVREELARFPQPPGVGELRALVREELEQALRREPVNDLATRLWRRLRRLAGAR